MTLSWYPEKQRVVAHGICGAPRAPAAPQWYFVDRVSRESSQTHERRTGRVGCRGEGRRGEDAFSWSARLGAANARRTLTPLVPACARRGIMIHNRPEFTQPRVKTHWELGIARGPECSALPEDGCAVRVAFKKSRGFRSSRRAIGRTAVHGSAYIVVPIRTRCRLRFDVRPPRSRPCQWSRPSRSRGHALDDSRRARGGLRVRAEPHAATRNFSAARTAVGYFSRIPSGTTSTRIKVVISVDLVWRKR